MFVRLSPTKSAPIVRNAALRMTRGSSATPGPSGRVASSRATPALTAVVTAIRSSVIRWTYGTANSTGKTMRTAKAPKIDGTTSGAATSSNQNVAQTATTAASTRPLSYSRSDQASNPAATAVAARSGHTQ